ncbi:MAG TPA: hypothetical protein VGR54_09365 [Nitrosopumilaceae archaeon]|nr:hypothetical protein [Nitrosopumilaceae archaeon]
MLDNSKKVFLSPSCLKDKTVMERILQVLDGYKVPKDKVFLEVDMNILNSGDYLVRCSDGVAHLFGIQLTLPFGFTTNLVEKISIK